MVLRSCKGWQLQPITLSAVCTTRRILSVLGGGPCIPYSDGRGDDGLYEGGVKLHHHLRWQFELPQLLQDEHPLLGLLNKGGDGRIPLMRDGGTHRETEGIYSGDGEVNEGGVWGGGDETFLSCRWL